MISKKTSYSQLLQRKEVTVLEECLPSKQKTLGSTASTTIPELWHRPVILALGMCRQEDQKNKVIFSYVNNLKPAWVV